MVPHEVYNEVLPRCKAQWPVEYRRKIKGERYQEQEHNMRTTCVSSPTTMTKNQNRTRGVTKLVCVAEHRWHVGPGGGHVLI